MLKLSSLSKKYWMAVTGLLLTGFVIAHMLGNLQVFLGPDSLNAYAHKLQSMPMLLWPARLFLLAVVGVHMACGLALAAENRASRPVRYQHEHTVKAPLASRTMAMTGIITFAFIVYHLLHFTFKKTYFPAQDYFDGHGYPDVYFMVVSSFRNIWVCGSYVVAMAALCYHLSHGLFSFPQSLGIDVKKHECGLRFFAAGVSWAIFIGNTSMPLAAYFRFIKLPGEF